MTRDLTLPRPVLFGAAYYPEYLPTDRLKTDLDLMADANFSVVRVGESVWSTWEPEDGRFDTDWMHPVLDGLAERGISAIFGTPTYAIPPWFARKYPEAMAHRKTAEPVPYGGRQNADFSHPAFRFHAERIIRRLVDEFASHPAIIGWQVDNETGVEILHNPAVFAGFVEELRRSFDDVDALNDAWGLTYWSHRIADWSELWTPDGNTVPGYDLAWRRFQARLTTEFLGWQADVVHELARTDQFVTTCLVGGYGRTTAEAEAISRRLDVVGVNPYYPMQDALEHPEPAGLRDDGRPQWMAFSGTWWLYLQADMAYGAAQRPFLVTETNAGAIGDSHTNYPAYDGQWRQAALTLVARGARMVEYWQWHTCHFGHEDHWIGVLGHSLEPGRCYEEVAQIGADLAAAGEELSGLEPDFDVTVLVSSESKWALEFHPSLSRVGGGEADPHSYGRIVNAFYRGFFDAGAQLRVAHTSQLDELSPDRCPILVVPALYVAADGVLNDLEQYARVGGHLVLGFRAGYADEHARMRASVGPGSLRTATGASYTEFANLARPLPVRAVEGFAPGELDGAHATAWAEGLELEGAQALLSYDHPHFGRFPVVTTHAYGAGRVTYVGTLPDPALGKAVAAWVLRTSGHVQGWPNIPEHVRHTSATGAAGRRLHFLNNWSWTSTEVTAVGTLRDVVSGDNFVTNERIHMRSWGARVLAEM